MEKSILNLNYKIEVLSEDKDRKQIIDSIQLVSNNPEVLITNRIKSDVVVESHISDNVDSVYIDYFKFFKKN